jgi:hypothetical protein
LLRAQPRAEAPDALRYRVLAAYERGVPATRLPRAVSPAWVGALAAAALVAAVVPAVMSAGPREPAGTLAAATAPLRIRVVEDRSLGMGSGAGGFSLAPFLRDTLDDAIDGP